ncbi:MAG: protein arginine kinase [bacterium]|jgi:protein arginine kinase
MTVEDMAKVPSPWLVGESEWCESVVSTRVRLARNLSAFAFCHTATSEDLGLARDKMHDAVMSTNTLKTGTYIVMSQIEELDRQFLVERHLISQEQAEKSGVRAVVVGDNEMVSVMINEEDHLRLQSIQPGFSSTEAWRLVDRLDTELDQKLEFAFSCDWGYLSACPTNTGTGMRASMLVHLPALVLTGQINRVLQGISQMGLAVRGFYGEGSDVMGNLFQISNRTALGTSELDILQSLDNVVRKVLEMEKHGREVLLRDARSQIEDKIWRAYGLLKYARRVTSQEVMSLSSAVRLGKCMGLVDNVSIGALNRMLFMSQPAHLQKGLGREMSPGQRDEERANMVRNILKEEESRASADNR